MRQRSNTRNLRTNLLLSVKKIKEVYYAWLSSLSLSLFSLSLSLSLFSLSLSQWRVSCSVEDTAQEQVTATSPRVELLNTTFTSHFPSPPTCLLVLCRAALSLSFSLSLSRARPRRSRWLPLALLLLFFFIFCFLRNKRRPQFYFIYVRPFSIIIIDSMFVLLSSLIVNLNGFSKKCV